MRIMFVVGSLSGGGAERVVSVLASKMAAESNDIYCALIASNTCDFQISNKVSVIDCSCSRSIKGLGSVNRVLALRDTIKKISPDVIISFTTEVNLYSLLATIHTTYKLIVCERNDPRFDPRNFVERKLRYLLYPRADGFVFQTKEEKQFFHYSLSQFIS